LSDGRLRLGVFKFASCDGCQMSILNLEADLLPLIDRLEVAHFLEASTRSGGGPYDVALVEGSITTERDAQRIRAIREQATSLITIGACATAGGIQALRNRGDVDAYKREVYPNPEWIECLATSTPIADHVRVDHQIHGCPVNPQQVLRVLLRALAGAAPDLPGASVCMECKRRGNVCVLVTRGVPCMGPVTREGCGALCPSLGRDCYACFGPSEDPNTDALVERFRALGQSDREVARRMRGVAGWRPEFRRVADRLEGGDE